MIVNHVEGNINCYSDLENVMKSANPDIVIHMAAQPLVRLSYNYPLETMQTNIMGTANVLEAALKCKKKPIVACITSDKCYENLDTNTPFNEGDRLGGYDPYSASKGGAELVAASFARSFYLKRNQSLLTLRGGNVIGGGDWSDDRIMTDIITALAADKSPIIRNPTAIRPWQHVLDVLTGYLMAINYVGTQKKACFEQFNIGPLKQNEATVGKLTQLACQIWGDNIEPIFDNTNSIIHEASTLQLDVTKAVNILGLKPKYDFRTTLLKTLDWYREEILCKNMAIFTRQQITNYFEEDN